MKKTFLSLVLLLVAFILHAEGNTAMQKSLRNGSAVDAVNSISFTLGKEVRPVAGHRSTPLEVMGIDKKAMPVMKAGDGTTLYGELCYTAKWESDVSEMRYGLYTFPASANTSLTEKFVHSSLPAFGGGAYGNGKLYFTSYYEGPVGLYYLYFCTMDLTTGEVNTDPLQLDVYTSIALDMAYDEIGNKLYSISYVDETGNDYTLSTIDTSTGLATTIAPIPRMSCIACDVTGQLYGVRYDNGMFCKIDKATAELTPIGSTGITPKYVGSATFDNSTGKLYWVTTSRSVEEESGLYEINLATGKANLISLFPNKEQLTSLFIPSKDEDSKMGEIQSFTADFEPNGATGTLSVKAPAVDADGIAIEGDMTVVVYDNSNLLFSLNASPGETVSKEVTLANGAHHLEAMATHFKLGKSAKKTLNLFVGTDGPAAVKNLTLAKSGDSKATLTWETPTEGAHGGEIKPNLLYYNIYRNPGRVLAAEDVDGTTWSETITSDLYRFYSYEVVGYYKGVEGASAESNQVVFGTPREIPYTMTFDTFEQYTDCVIYNENNDEGYWGYFPTKQCAAYRYDTFNQADDYLVMPAVRFEAGKSYKLKYKAASDADFLYPESMEVKMGRSHMPAQLDRVIVKEQQYPHSQLREYEAVIDNITETGAYFIAFHALTEKGQYFLYVDDVEIISGPASAAPGLVENLKATPAPNAALSTTISFNAPSKDFSGNTLGNITEITVSREGKVLSTFKNPAPGAELSCVDNSPKQGLNTYVVIATNGSGDGNPAEITIWAGIDTPGAVTDATHTTENGIDAIVKWTAPEGGANGGTLDYSKLTYTITRNDDVVVVTGLKETTYVDRTIDTSVSQKNVFYNIVAVNEAGSGEAVKTSFMTYGTPYKGEYHESFKGGEVETKPWVIDVVTPSLNPTQIPYWKVETSGLNPAVLAQDGDGGLVSCYRNTPWASSRIISPKLTAEGMKNPVLSFYFFHYYNPDTENGWSTQEDKIQPEVYVDGKYSNLTEKPLLLMNGQGWYKYEILLNDFVNNKEYYKIAFLGTSGTGYNMHIDNIAITDAFDNDLSISSFTGSERLAVGTTRKFTATVHNSGAKQASGYKVVLYRDGEAVNEIAGTSTLKFGETEDVVFEISANIADAGATRKYSAEVVYASDENLGNNKSTEITTTVPAPNYPAVSDLTAVANNGKVVLSWSEPPALPSGGVEVEGFENTEAFTISDFGDWSVYDGDMLETYGISNASSESGIYEYPNACSQMAFMAFNPKQAGITSELWTPFSGNQMAVSFASVGGQSNDWLISPEVDGGQTVSFYAKSPSIYYGEEEFYFCYSTTDNVYSSFKPVGGLVKVPTATWTKFSFELPDDAKYFAINCVSNDKFALLVDDIEFESKASMLLELQGFNVYRDKQIVNNEVVGDFTYTDDSMADKTKSYTYQVSTVYDKGESLLSNEVTVVPAGGVDSVGAILPFFYVDGGIIYVKNADGLRIAVNSMSGVTYFNGIGGSNMVAIELPSGVYAVTIDGITSKAIVK